MVLMHPIAEYSEITNDLMFEVFKQQWTFDKLSGNSEPIFLTPKQIADSIRNLVNDPSGTDEWWIHKSLHSLRQLNLQQLIQREKMSVKNSSHRISGYAARLLKAGHYREIKESIELSTRIELGAHCIDVYQANRTTSYS